MGATGWCVSVGESPAPWPSVIRGIVSCNYASHTSGVHSGHMAACLGDRHGLHGGHYVNTSACTVYGQLQSQPSFFSLLYGIILVSSYYPSSNPDPTVVLEDIQPQFHGTRDVLTDI